MDVGTMHQLREALRGRVVAAALTPMRPDRSVVHEAVGPYAAALRDAGVGGIAVGAHTGRGAHLPPAELGRLVGEFAVGSGLPIIAGVSRPPGAEVTELVELGERLAGAGAAALLVGPFGPLATAGPETIVRVHQRLGEATGLPLIGFVLYEAPGQQCYGIDLAAELAGSRYVLGVKMALLSDAVGCQDLIAAVRARAPEALILTGEDRMYGPSLMWGADAALLGIAAALPSWSVAVLDAWIGKDHAGFVSASRRLDGLAGLTFTEPMEAYVQKMAWIAAWQQILPEEVALDPFGPALPPAERARLLSAVSSLAAGG